MKVCFLFALILVMKLNVGETVTCDKVNACKCKYSDGSGLVDITSLSGKSGKPRFNDVDGTDTLKYSYNPCLSFDEGGQYGCVKVAVCQVYSFTQISGGSQESAKFVLNAKGQLTLEYSQTYTTTTVDLICDKTAKEPVFKAIGDPGSTNEIKLSMTHACNCPGICDDKGIISGGGGGGSTSSGLSVGTILCIIVVVCLPCYIIAGILINMKIRQRSGTEVIPNVSFWVAMPGYIKDGVLFSVGRVTKRGQYAQI